MNKRWLGYVWIIVFCWSYGAFGQVSNIRSGQVKVLGDTILRDSLLIYPGSLKISCGGQELSSGDFRYEAGSGAVIISNPCSDTLTYFYRVLPIPYKLTIQNRDTSQIYYRFKGDREKFLLPGTPTNSDIFGGSSLSKSGSISRGVTFGNNQNLGINSSLNLELSGDVAPNLKLLAVVTDDNLPIQPEGNTNQLREFDQVFIQLYNDRMKLIAGDFWLRKPQGYFMNYQKRAQGLTFEQTTKLDSTRQWTSQSSAALSRGKFNRQIIQGVEGNQGPYRLTGVENEPFIIVLSGTEQVFIDGKILKRGQAYDYVINYNTAEVIFTSRNLITKDSRIVIEFQYSDQNYARSVVQNSISYSSKKTEFWLNAYSEQDAKNQSLQQELSLNQKGLLAQVGDTLNLARSSSIDSIGYLENQVMYELLDSLGFDSVLVSSVNQSEALYRAVFQSVGQGNGNYVFDGFNALGRVYKWVAPVGGISQGSFAPSRLLVAPKKQSMVSLGVRQQLNKRWSIQNELATSTFDKNTFSRGDSFDDKGYANRFQLKGIIPVGAEEKKKSVELTGASEIRDPYFQEIQQYRAVEFDRDWNTRNKGYSGQQVFSTFGGKFIQQQRGFVHLEGQQFNIGKDFEGYKGVSEGNWSNKGFQATWDASYLSSRSALKNQFIRHRSEISQNIGRIKIGYKDDHERNKFRDNQSPLSPNSYQFFDYQFYIGSIDSAKNEYKVFYRERFDLLSDSTELRSAAKGTSVGGEINLKQLKNQSLNIVTSYRQLEIRDTTLINQKPENTILGRLEYELRAWKGALTLNNFYEAGSGLEQRREFLYIKVNDGQGIYAWIDYNGDGVKDLGEFEVAQFVDQASYIRVFTPSNVYTKTFSNELNQSLYWRPERLWASRKGVLKFVSLFSNQSRYRVLRKTTDLNGFAAFVPNSTGVRDTNLISTTSNFRNSLFFNRTSNIFSVEYLFQNIQSKNLLASGFDARLQRFNELAPRLNIARVILLTAKYQRGQRISAADYTSGRNYDIQYFFVEPSIAYQPNTKFRITLMSKYTEKENALDYGGQKAYLGEIGTDLKYNQSEKGSFQASFKTIQITYSGNPNSALGFEMLEALKPGTNFTWNAGYQRSVSTNLQISIQYNGRKSELNQAIHSGGMEVRAFF
jgi:hypothetical protein